MRRRGRVGGSQTPEPPAVAARVGTSATATGSSLVVTQICAVIVATEALWLGTTVLRGGDLRDVFMLCTAVAVAMASVKHLAHCYFAPRFTGPADTQTVTKLQDQSWHLVLHVSFAIAEGCVLFMPDSEGVVGGWSSNTTRIWSIPLEQQQPSNRMRWLYLASLATWLTTAIGQFFKPAQKDQAAMLVHHIATTFLVGASHSINAHRIGLLILFVHELSDIPCDLLKIANHLGLSGPSYCFLVEGLFVSVMVSWAYLRLWVLPTQYIWSLVVEAPADLPYWSEAVAFLLVLQCLHVYWFALFCRILAGLLSGQSASDVAEKEYEGVGNDRSAAGGGGGSGAKPSRSAASSLPWRCCAAVGWLLSLLATGVVAGLALTPSYLRATEYTDTVAEAAAVAASLAGLKGPSAGEPLLAIPPLHTVFQLGESATDEQRAFLRHWGFVHFKQPLSTAEVEMLQRERERLQHDLLARNVTSVYGVPLFRGGCPTPSGDGGNGNSGGGGGGPLGCVHRIPFASVQSEPIKRLVHEQRLVGPISELFTDEFFTRGGRAATTTVARVGDAEKDGVVLNSYVGQHATDDAPPSPRLW